VHSQEDQDRALLAGETIMRLSDTPLFGELPLSRAPSPQGDLRKEKATASTPIYSFPKPQSEKNCPGFMKQQVTVQGTILYMTVLGPMPS
jgi:hypothetical protein